jgi:hypothetical protein
MGDEGSGRAALPRLPYSSAQRSHFDYGEISNRIHAKISKPFKLIWIEIVGYLLFEIG